MQVLQVPLQISKRKYDSTLLSFCYSDCEHDKWLDQAGLSVNNISSVAQEGLCLRRLKMPISIKIQTILQCLY